MEYIHDVIKTGSCSMVVGEQGTKQLAVVLNCGCYLYDGYSHAVYDEAPDFLSRIYDFFTN